MPTSRTQDLPATQGMLQLVRSESKADLRELRSEMKSGFKKIDASFNQIDARFNQIDARFNQNDSRFDATDAKLERVLSEVSRIGILVEEQNSRNRVVLEGLTGLWQRQDRVETRLDEVEKLVQSFSRARR